MGSGHSVQVIAVTSGKGGVGKTTVAVNLSVALAKLGRRVVLLDADLGLASIDSLLGLSPKYTLADVIEGRCELSDILVLGPRGIRIAPGASGIEGMSHLSPAQHSGLIHAFSNIADSLDVLVIDTAPGINDSVLSFLRAAQEIMVVVCNEPASITDAYALIKLLHRNYGLSHFRVLANMELSHHDGRDLFYKLTKITDQFLNVTLRYAGAVPYDESVRKSVQMRRAVYESFPRSRVTKAFQKLALQVDAWPLPGSFRGGIEFFSEQLISNSNFSEDAL